MLGHRCSGAADGFSHGCSLLASEASPLSVHVNRDSLYRQKFGNLLEATWYSKQNVCA